MDLEFDDETFVRAPPEFVCRWLVDFSNYPAWWPGFRIVRAVPGGMAWDGEAARARRSLPPSHPPACGRPPAEPGELDGRSVEPGASLLTFELRVRRLRRPIRVAARPYRFRPAKGVFIDLRGDLVGVAEWWLEEGWGGTVVHHLARADTARRRPATLAAAYRASVRRATWGLKDAVQSEVRGIVGLSP